MAKRWRRLTIFPPTTDAAQRSAGNPINRDRPNSPSGAPSLSSASFARHQRRRSIHDRRLVAPAVAQVGRDVGDLLIRELPGEARHASRARGRGGLVPMAASCEDQMSSGWVCLLHHAGIVTERRKDSRLTDPVFQMAGGAGIRLAPTPRRIAAVSGDRDEGWNGRLVFQIDRYGVAVYIVTTAEDEYGTTSAMGPPAPACVAAGAQVFGDIIEAQLPRPVRSFAARSGADPVSRVPPWNCRPGLSAPKAFFGVWYAAK